MPIRVVTLISIIVILCTNSWAWNDELTHPRITEKILPLTHIDSYYFRNLNITDAFSEKFNDLTILEAIQKGSELEDFPNCRAANHFLNPNLTWSEAGLLDKFWLTDLLCLIFSSYNPESVVSNITWATGVVTKDPLQENDVILDNNKMDWLSGREYYYGYLTGYDFNGAVVATNEEERDELMAKALQALGQVVHLLQDTAVPAHVRDDFSQGHTMWDPTWKDAPWKWLGNGFEQWIKGKETADWFSQSIMVQNTEPTLTDFWDTTDQAGANITTAQNAMGLAEFTAMNFISEYQQLYTSKSPYPQAAHIDIVSGPLNTDPNSTNRQYLSTTTAHPGTQVEHLAVVSYLQRLREIHAPNVTNEPLPINFDDNCYEEYASKLIPRAIGYSAGLIDYFFRGEMEVKAVPFFFDNFGSTPNQLYNIFVKVKNTTPGEVMKDGTFSLHYNWDNNGTVVYGEAPCGTIQCGTDCIDLVPSGELSENDEKSMQFYFPSDGPITTENFHEIEWTLVFTGVLGKENRTVIGKVFPTIDQQANDWGQVIFNEEWETLEGASENSWGHGSCWKDAGLTGYHLYNEAYGGLLNYTLRTANYSTESVACGSSAQPNVLIDENTWIQFLLFTEQVNPIREDEIDKQSQYIKFELSNGITLYFYEGDLTYWPNELPDDPDNIFIPFFSGNYLLQNIYAILNNHGVSVSEPLYLERILIFQSLEAVNSPPPVEQSLIMRVNAIRLVNTDSQFGLCN